MTPGDEISAEEFAALGIVARADAPYVPVQREPPAPLVAGPPPEPFAGEITVEEFAALGIAVPGGAPGVPLPSADGAEGSGGFRGQVSLEEFAALGIVVRADAPYVPVQREPPAPLVAGPPPEPFVGEISPEEFAVLGIRIPSPVMAEAGAAVALEPRPGAASAPAPAAARLVEEELASLGLGGEALQAEPLQRTTPVPNGQRSIAPVELRPANSGARNLDALMDVILDVTAELGGVNLAVAEVLALRPGTILSLDTLAEEPVTLQINGKPIARGDVVVVDERFAVRVVTMTRRVYGGGFGSGASTVPKAG